MLKVDDVDVVGASSDQVAVLIGKAGASVRLTVESCALHVLIEGTVLTKARAKPVKRRFRLSPDLTRIHWHSKHRSRDDAVYRIGDIKEVRCVHGVAHTAGLT